MAPSTASTSPARNRPGLGRRWAPYVRRWPSSRCPTPTSPASTASKAPHAALRPTVTLRPTPTTPSPMRKTKRRERPRRLDWATLHQHTERHRRLALPLWRPPAPSRHPLHQEDGKRSASSNSATASPVVTSSRPPPPSPPSRWLADGHPLASLAIAGGAPVCPLPPFHPSLTPPHPPRQRPRGRLRRPKPLALLHGFALCPSFCPSRRSHGCHHEGVFARLLRGEWSFAGS